MNKRMLEYQADRIEAVLAQHRILARVTGGTVTPRWVRFQVVPALGVRIAAITGLAEELAAALDVPAVRVARQGAMIAVEVPRDDPRPVRLLPLLEGLRNIPPVTAVLGVADDGVPLLIRLPSPDVAHILVAGTTGSGKTMLLRAMVLSLAYFNGPERLAFVLVDPKGRAFADMASLPHLARPVITEPQEAVEALESLVRLMNRRRGDGHGDARVVVLVIDELADLMMATDIEQPLTRLLQRGREAGIHVVAATQKPTAAVVGSLVKANFPVRLVGKVTSPEDARVATGWKGSGAERLLGRGDFIAVAEGQLHRFQAAWVGPEAVESVLGRWGRRHSLAVSPVAPRPAGMTLPPVADAEESVPDPVETLAERLRPWWIDHRGEWGAKTAAVRHLFGDVPAGGHYWDLTMAAIERLEAEISTSTSTPTGDSYPDGIGEEGSSEAG